MPTRLKRSQVLGLSGKEVDQFIENDFDIRSGQCPNKCGPLTFDGGLQECPVCGFHTSYLPEASEATAIKAGDIVRHRPSGETWIVKQVKDDRLYPYGWPTSCARLSDCELVETKGERECANTT